MNGYEVCRRLARRRADGIPAGRDAHRASGRGSSRRDRGGCGRFPHEAVRPAGAPRPRAVAAANQALPRHDRSAGRRARGVEPDARGVASREQLEELEKMARLRRFLSPTLAELILTQGEAILESHRREIAVLFADLRGWTDFSATTEPEEVMSVIGSFHAAMGELILDFEATVGWFAGDGLMVWFNDPVPCLDPAASAVRLAVAMREAMGELRAAWREARPRPRLLGRDRTRLRDARADRLRGPVRLRRGRQRDEPRVTALRRGGAGGKSSSAGGCSLPSRRSPRSRGRRAQAQRLRKAGRGVHAPRRRWGAGVMLVRVGSACGGASARRCARRAGTASPGEAAGGGEHRRLRRR